MKQFLIRMISIFLCAVLLLPAVPSARAYENTELDLSGYIRNSGNRHYAESVLSYHLRENAVVRAILEGGLCALFFIEGCSDNMLDPMRSDLLYYRVSAVCIAVKLDDAGEPQVVYFNEDASTLPDRALSYGAWQLEEVGEVGPATVCDGTYELYSVYHAGSYEALHLRTTYSNDTIAAVYMTPEGFVTSAANAINIHTRNVDHILEKAMWSAGCLLVGDGEWMEYANLIVASYYSTYDRFFVDRPVGCVTINRQRIREQMNTLYENEEAVETLLAGSADAVPEVYLEQCSQAESFPERTVRAKASVSLMTLPCTNASDARSVTVMELSMGEKIDICGSIRNAQGQQWYEVSFFGENCYVPAGNMEEVPETLLDRIRSFFNI